MTLPIPGKITYSIGPVLRTRAGPEGTVGVVVIEAEAGAYKHRVYRTHKEHRGTKYVPVARFKHRDAAIARAENHMLAHGER